MAAPRKYSTAQRQEIWRLHESGMNSREITEACARGTAGASAFAIPRRTVSAVIAAMEQEARRSLPSTIEDAGTLETVHRFPERIARIVDEELGRLETKQRRGKLTAKDMDVLRKASEVTRPLRARLEGNAQRPARDLAKRSSPALKEDAVTRLARRLAAEEGAGVRPAHKRSRPTTDASQHAERSKPQSDLPGSHAAVVRRRPLNPGERASAVAAVRRAAEEAAPDEARRKEIAASFDHAHIAGGSGSSGGSGCRSTG